METSKNSDIGQSMLPFVMRELSEIVMKKKALSLEDALRYIYSSGLYGLLINEDTKMWYSSTLSLYESLEKEKVKKRKKQNNNKDLLLFKMFCIENYRNKNNLSASDTLKLFTRNDVFKFLEDNFEMLHTQDEEYILDTITTYIKKNKQ